MSDPTRTTPGDPLAGYTSPPPPGAGGLPSQEPFGAPAAGHWQLAGWWRRVAAHLLDGVVIGIGALILLVLLGAILGGSGFLIGDATGIAGLILGLVLWFAAIAVAALFYAPWMMARTNGQTLGRMAVGTRVVRPDGKPIDFGFAMLREVVVKWLVFGLLLGSITAGIAVVIDYLWPLWDEENRALHDLLVNTRTIRT
jgi:uncharacterized RDD family membrane protein YckC